MWADVGRQAGYAHIGRNLVKIWGRKLPPIFMPLNARSQATDLSLRSVASHGKLSAVDQILEDKGPGI